MDTRGFSIRLAPETIKRFMSLQGRYYTATRKKVKVNDYVTHLLDLVEMEMSFNGRSRLRGHERMEHIRELILSDLQSGSRTVEALHRFTRAPYRLVALAVSYLELDQKVVVTEKKKRGTPGRAPKWVTLLT